MEQTNVVEMEMSVLSGFNVEGGDESEYVFIQDDDMDFDDESYDHCDLSPDLSCAASVCSGVTLGDFKDVGASMVSLEDRNDGESKYVKEDVTMDAMNAPGRRLCNKKRRKKLKMLKKAAAAAHFEASRKAQEAAEAETLAPERSVSERESRSKSRAKSKSKSGVNLAVACAHESIAAYREEVGGKKKSIVNYVL
ncbi:hypothetical protein ACHAXN_006872 [Cyclotella atomus]|jgi:hypothetical protein